MQKYKQATISISLLTIIFSAGLYNSSMESHSCNILSTYESKHKEVEEILASIEDDDYDEWKALISKKAGPGLSVTRNDFAEFIQARNMARSGKYEEAIRLAKNLENRLRQKIDLRALGIV